MDNGVAIFTPYPFQVGERLRITGGPRQGDWRVVGLTDAKVTLECPVSGQRVTWARFCYLVERRGDLPWPQEEGQRTTHHPSSSQRARR